MGNDRLDRLIEEATLEEKVARLQGGSGNRVVERTTGAVDALRKAQKFLTDEVDGTTEITTGFVKRDTITPKFGPVKLVWLTMQSPKYLSIGDKTKNNASEYVNGCEVHTEILREIKGTRVEILKNFVQELEKDRESR